MPSKSKASAEAYAEAMAAFHSDEPFRAVASRLRISPNTLRVKWKEAYVEDAFEARSKAFQQKGAEAYGLRTRGVAKTRNFVSVLCRSCQTSMQVTRLSLSRSGGTVCCDSCRDKDKNRTCPVCNLACDGAKGLATHFWKQDDAGHKQYLADVEKAKWDALQENVEYVSCAVCGFKALALNGHLRTHGLSADSYRERFIGHPIQSENWLQAKSDNAVQFRHNLTVEDLSSCVDTEGRVVVEAVCSKYNCVSSTVLGYCRKYGLPTRNKLAWQKVVLDQAKRYLGSEYVWEWSDPRITNPETGRVLNFDGYFPEHNLILEAHGDQHFRYSEKWHGSKEAFEKLQARDAFKRKRAEELGFWIKVVRPTDDVMGVDFWSSFLGGDTRHWENTPALEKESRVEEVLLRLRSEGWPDISPSTHAKAELSMLRNLTVFLDESRQIHPYSIRGTGICASFFPNRYRARYKDSPSVFDAWSDDTELRKAIRLQLDSSHPTTALRVLKALVLYHRTPSVFRPAVAKYVCQTYAPEGVVWDPCSGYGGRLMGAMAAGVQRYLGTDVEADTVEGNRHLAQELELSSRCTVNNAKAEEFDPGSNLDLVFTSPPYYNLETYGKSSDSRSYGSVQAWIQAFLNPVIHRAFNSLKTGGHLVLNLPNRPVCGYRLDSVSLVAARNIGFEERPPIWMPVRSFRGAAKAEPLLVWVKP